jgi:hypothetical protein
MFLRKVENLFLGGGRKRGKGRKLRREVKMKNLIKEKGWGVVRQRGI